jgi:hypothetical protein
MRFPAKIRRSISPASFGRHDESKLSALALLGLGEGLPIEGLVRPVKAVGGTVALAPVSLKIREV